ncbi:MAG: polysulfide reductase NrfD, partial [Chloroflexota bacterium]
ITLDLSSIALSAGAFSLCAAVYLLKLTKLKPLARTAAFIGLIGYTMAMLCLLLDIGRPDRFWHGFVYWNTHSVLWEVTMCVGLYFGVLVMENLSTFASLSWLNNKFPKLSNWMKKSHDYAPYLAIAGLLLSMLHQSSLGATYGVLIGRPIWYRPGLAVIFFISAIAGGISLTILATLITSYFHKFTFVNQRMLDPILRFLAWLLLGYLYFRFWDMFAMSYTQQPGREEALAVLTKGLLSVNLWIGEILLGIVVPIFILFNPKTRQNRFWLILSLAFVAGGVLAYRWDTNLVGLLVVQLPLAEPTPLVYASYFPSIIEYISAAGIIAFGVFVFTLGVKNLQITEMVNQ